MVVVTDATEREILYNSLKKELENTKDILLDLESGIIKADNLLLAPNFYIAKKDRLEATLWVYEVEDRALKAQKEKPQNVET